MASLIYAIFKEDVMEGAAALETATNVKCMLTHDYTVDGTAHVSYNDVSGQEVTGTGYTAGGAVLTGLAVTVDNTNNLGKFDASDITWTTSTLTANGAVLYQSGGPLICYIDFGSDKSSSAGNFTIQWSTSGIIQLT
jgi:hypothetical protein